MDNHEDMNFYWSKRRGILIIAASLFFAALMGVVTYLLYSTPGFLFTLFALLGSALTLFFLFGTVAVLKRIIFNFDPVMTIYEHSFLHYVGSEVIEIPFRDVCTIYYMKDHGNNAVGFIFFDNQYYYERLPKSLKAARSINKATNHSDVPLVNFKWGQVKHGKKLTKELEKRMPHAEIKNEGISRESKPRSNPKIYLFGFLKRLLALFIASVALIMYEIMINDVQASTLDDYNPIYINVSDEPIFLFSQILVFFIVFLWLETIFQKNHPSTVRILSLASTVIFIFSLPFIYLGIHSYDLVSEEGVYASEYWSFADPVFRGWEEVSSLTVDYNVTTNDVDEPDNVYPRISFNYDDGSYTEFINTGNSAEVNDFTGFVAALEIAEEQNIPMSVEQPLNDELVEVIEDEVGWSDEEKEEIYNLYSP
ncbi:hypothetical protein HUG20_16865 [Salicibibacter cibi]|uniref:Uncharacterized protein n=1 Tax=Salicibibacter cibi TaxID=2743001 RepID=A0A7T6ZE70_9BACI|nr:hypothetical protein [Salicibibacter cibi]QQK81416.1 hypothetical protein HUG20_16865 [Salicibibacter cibi]